jgi:hypothetical protein
VHYIAKRLENSMESLCVFSAESFLLAREAKILAVWRPWRWVPKILMSTVHLLSLALSLPPDRLSSSQLQQ